MAFLISLVSLGLLSICTANPCYDLKYAKYPNHTMCLKPRSCPGKKLLTPHGLDNEDKLAVLHVFNTFRSLIATGRTPGYYPATNMQQLTWDDVLGDISQRRADYCSWDGDFDVRDDRFEVGQVITKTTEVPFKIEIAHPLNIHTLAKLIYVRAFDGSYPARFLNQWMPSVNGTNLTQLIWAESNLVGCGASIFSQGSKGVRMLVCNFAPKGNKVNEPVYVIGEPDCDIESKHYKGLCATREVNKKFEPIPCDDNRFARKYVELCSDDDALYKWIGHGTPLPYVPCDEKFWEKMYRGSIWAVVATYLAMFSGLVFFTYQLFVPFRIYLV